MKAGKTLPLRVSAEAGESVKRKEVSKAGRWGNEPRPISEAEAQSDP